MAPALPQAADTRSRPQALQLRGPRHGPRTPPGRGHSLTSSGASAAGAPTWPPHSPRPRTLAHVLRRFSCGGPDMAPALPQAADFRLNPALFTLVAFYRSWPLSSSLTTSGAMARARASSSASVRLAIGCGTERNLYAGTPHDWAMAWPVLSKTSVTMDAAGTPIFSNRIPSSTLPDEQDPQSPMPATTTSTACLASSRISRWASTPELCLRHIRASAAPYSVVRMTPIFCSSLSELNLVFSTSPMRLPLRESGRGTYVSGCRRGSTVGSRISKPAIMRSSL